MTDILKWLGIKISTHRRKSIVVSQNLLNAFDHYPETFITGVFSSVILYIQN